MQGKKKHYDATNVTEKQHKLQNINEMAKKNSKNASKIQEIWHSLTKRQISKKSDKVRRKQQQNRRTTQYQLEFFQSLVPCCLHVCDWDAIVK